MERRRDDTKRAALSEWLELGSPSNILERVVAGIAHCPDNQAADAGVIVAAAVVVGDGAVGIDDVVVVAAGGVVVDDDVDE